MPIKTATVEVKQNLHLVVRERGKIVARRDGHNIWLDLGREYLAKLIAYSSFTPLTTYRDDRIRYMGFGIGGTKQNASTIANTAPIVTAYPGTNTQTDEDPTVTELERPVRLSGTSTPPPYNANDLWLGQVQAPPTFAEFNKVTFRRLLTSTEASYSPFKQVPLSEIGLFTGAANPLIPHNSCVAYDTFDTLTKTDAFELEVAWTIVF